MGGSGGFDPVSIVSNMVFSAVAGGLIQKPAGSGPADASAAEAERLAEEQEAKTRRAEDRRAEEAVLKVQARKQQLSLGRQTAALATSLGEGGSLAGQSMHGSDVIAATQLKEKLGQ